MICFLSSLPILSPSLSLSLSFFFHSLPIPWLLYGILFQAPVEVNSCGMVCSIAILFMMLLFVIASIACFQWRMNKGLGVTMFLLYFVFVAISLMFEYKHLTCPFWSEMTKSKGNNHFKHTQTPTKHNHNQQYTTSINVFPTAEHQTKYMYRNFASYVWRETNKKRCKMFEEIFNANKNKKQQQNKNILNETHWNWKRLRAENIAHTH